MLLSKTSVKFYATSLGPGLPNFDIVWQKKIKHAIAAKLSTQPQLYGKPLRRTLKGYRKLRVGNYRVIFRIDKKTVKIFAIQHRSVVYNEATKRT